MGSAATLANPPSLENKHPHQGAWAPGTTSLPQQLPLCALPCCFCTPLSRGPVAGGKNPPTPREKAAEQRPHPKEVGKKENLLVACLSCALEGMSEFPFCTRTPKLSHSQCLVQVLSPPSLPDSTHLLPGGPGLAVPLPSPLQASDSSFLARLHTLPPLRPCQQQPTSHGPHLAPFEHILPSFVPPLSLPRGLSGKYP